MMMMMIRTLGVQPYLPIWEDMKKFTHTRGDDTPDELWLLEHLDVYTQGQTGKAEHILNPGSIPIIQTDRGGQVTFHGPGQLIAYVLMDIRRRNIGIRTLVCELEHVLITLLATLDITASTRCGAPGVYVGEKKIASIGLRVKNGCSYHGISLNVAMDLTPFSGINPCGHAQLHMTQIKEHTPEINMLHVQALFSQAFLTQFGP